ncbi:MAG: hypothetical protein HY909_15275 [Deltaproteobacteria bacterium]|nr:hypothetical protein [Deltaproteobacteria bacterium]
MSEPPTQDPEALARIVEAAVERALANRLLAAPPRAPERSLERAPWGAALGLAAMAFVAGAGLMYLVGSLRQSPPAPPFVLPPVAVRTPPPTLMTPPLPPPTPPTPPPAPRVDPWARTATEHRGHNGNRVVYNCPAGGSPHTVWGSGPYTDDSSVCSAAVHAGVISAAEGGEVTMELRPGRDRYQGTARNGVESRPYGAWPGSFVVLSQR